MYQPISLFIALRYMTGRDFRSNRFGCVLSWLSVIGLILGVMVLVTVSSVMNGLEEQLEHKILGFMPHVLVTSQDGFINPQKISASKLHFSGVNRISSLTTGEVILHGAHNIATGVILGVDPNKNDALVPFFLNVKQKQLQAGKYNAIIGAALANHLGLRLNSKVRLLVPTRSWWTPLGRIPSQKVFNVIGIFLANSDVDSYAILLNQEDASRLMRYQKGCITGWRLWLNNPLQIHAIKQHAMQQGGLLNGLVWHDWRETKGALFHAVKIEKNIMRLLLGLIILIAVFNIFTSLCLLIAEKKWEVAILQTQGFKREQILIIFILQGAMVGVLGSIIGSLLGICLAKQLPGVIIWAGIFGPGLSLPVLISASQITMIAFFSTIIAFLSVLYPSYRAASVKPAEALRYD
ncbi:lipoprotein-releasing ABC transporter permease subunit LolC [Candidatus Erwinia haradaeae]|uniref:Lipoprotein-releasing system transmembrane protein LolC n=1 Tax=Candidatus Erwinia haradaeae TaxID=1922217 RepID=A0A451D4M7_9GAMM|nr:lipoprotein-releasing ABC transporter permease subunit LolC [Candidatus Erwinia haradaeae]VFP80654.1 Lipoprotein-releasing system transmembrane protein LolC [Candidatus Erwinia haradaeae]